MKRTLITIALTTVVVLTLVGGTLFALTNSLGGGMTASAPSAYRSFDGGYGGGASPEMLFEVPAAAPMPASDFSKVGNTVDTGAPAADVERKIIKNADMSVVVKDPVQSMADITALADELGGYVVSSNLYQSTYGPNNITVPQGNISIRVPADKLDSALEQIKKSSVEVQSQNVSGQDVTDQYVDLQSRLTAKQAAEKKLLEIMDKTEKAEDTMAVYAQLQQVQSDIEILKGQIKFIDQSAALSSLNVNLIAEAGTQPIEIGGWKLQGTAKQSIQDLIRFTQGFTRFLIQLILLILPALILIAIPLYGLFIGGRALYRRFGKSRVVAEVKEEKK